MMLSHKPLGLAITMLLTACGGGGSGDSEAGKAVSSSPTAPVVSTQTQSAVTPPPPANAPGNSEATPDTREKPAAPPLQPAPVQPEDTSPTQTAETGANPTAAEQNNKGSETTATEDPDKNGTTTQPEQQVLLRDGQLSGQAIMTMLESKAPVYTIWVPQRAPIFRPRPNQMFAVSARSGEILPYPEYEKYPGIMAYSAITPDNYVQISPSGVYHGTSSRYQPAKGDFELNVSTQVTNVFCISCNSTQLFINMTMTVKGHAGENDFTLDEEMKIKTSRGWPMEDESDKWNTYNREFTLVSTQAQTFSRTAYFPANLPIQTWRAGAGTAKLFWRPGPNTRDVDLCWDIMSDFNVNRLTCTTWTLQEDWKYGLRFSGGGMYMEDDRSALYNGETGKHLYRVDPTSIDLLHG